MYQSEVIHSMGNYINGTWVKDGNTIFESINPADGTLVWQGHHATKNEISSAHTYAHKALSTWCTTSFSHRAHIIREFAKQVELKRDALTTLIAKETGKPLWESATEVTAVINKIELSIQAYEERTSPKSTVTGDTKASLRYKPQGVVVVLGAYNFPAHLSNGHIVPALLAGNTLLYKPSELTPAVAELIMQCWHASGIPAGVLNMVQGDAQCGSQLLSENIQGVYFTGSYATGLRIHKQFSDRPEVILALEMGGNNPLVIDEVNDVNAAVYQTLLSTLITSGQRCTCARRLMIPNTAQGDDVLERFIKACTSLRIGPYSLNPEPFMGPVISHAQALNHLKSQKVLNDVGGKSLLSMTLLQESTGFVSPGIMDMTHVDNAPDEELFGPFVQVYRYNEFEEAIRLANKTRYGLAAGLLSDRSDHYELFFKSVRAGLINWNKPTTGAASNLPFGGVGISGNHRPSAYFAADYCAYPIASMETEHLSTPRERLPGIVLE